MAPTTLRYRERLSVPAFWWVLAFLFALSCGVVVGFYLGPVLGIAVGLTAAAAGIGVLVSAGILIEVDDHQLRVGRAMIELEYLRSCRSLDEVATTNRSGAGADARAYLVLRPYVPTAIEVTLDDPADPVPYWLISTRHPQTLAGVLEQARLRARGSA